jgi:WD40 repeat protein
MSQVFLFRQAPPTNRRVIVDAFLIITLSTSGSVVGAQEQNPVEESVSFDECVVEITSEHNARVFVDGKDYGTRRRLVFKNITAGARLQTHVVARFGDGAQAERRITLVSGQLIRCALYSPLRNVPELVIQNGFISTDSAVFSSEGRYLAVGTSSDEVSLFEVETGHLVRTFTRAGIHKVDAIDPTSQYMITNVFENGFYLWNISSGELVRFFTDVGGPDKADFSADGRFFYLLGDQNVILFDLAARRETLRLPVPRWTARVSFALGGTTLLVGDYNIPVLSAYDCRTGRKLWSTNAKWIYPPYVTTGGNRVILDSGVVLDAASGKRANQLPDVKGTHPLAVTRDGRYALSRTNYSNMDVYHLEDLSLKKTIRDFRDETARSRSPSGASPIQFSADGRRVVAFAEKNLIVRDLQTGHERVLSKNAWGGTLHTPRNLALLVPGSEGGKDLPPSIIDLATGRTVSEMPRPVDVGGTAAFDLARNCYWIPGLGKATRVDLKTGEANVVEIPGMHYMTYTSGALMLDILIAGRGDAKYKISEKANDLYEISDGEGFSIVGPSSFNDMSLASRMCVNGSEKGGSVYDLNTGEVLRQLEEVQVKAEEHAYDSFQLAMNGDGSLVYGVRRGHVCCWDASTGQLLFNRESPGKWYQTIDVSADGRVAIAGVISLDANFRQFEPWFEIIDPRSGQPTTAWRRSGPQLQALDDAIVAQVRLTNDNCLAARSRGGVFWLYDYKQNVQLREIDTGRSLRSMEVSDDSRLLYTSSEEGLVRIWDLPTGDELASLADVESSRVMVCASNGYFDGPSDSFTRIGYRIGRGLKVVPVDRFFNDFYRPGLLEEVQLGYRPKPETSLAQTAAPSLKITSPEPNEVRDQLITVVAEAVDQGGGVARLAVYQNGARVLADGETRQEGKTTYRTFKLSLVEGENRIKVTAANRDGSWEAEPVQVIVRYERPLKKPELYVVAVGIDRYADANFNLQYAVRDSDAIAKLFENRGKALYKQVHVTQLNDQDATKTGIKDAFKQVAAKTRPQDTMLAFLAGHGAMVGQRYFFVPHELRPKAEKLDDDLRTQGLAADELYDYLGSANALKRVLILDTCASGGALGTIVSTSRSGFALRGAVERLSRSQGVFSIAASAATAEAQESKELGHGILSYALLAGLDGVEGGPLDDNHVEPTNPDRVVDVMEWFAFAAGQVPRLTEKYYGAAQDVQTYTSGMSFPVLPLD